MARNVQFDIRAVDKTAQAFRSVKQRVGGLTKSIFSLRNALAGAAGAMAFQSLATGSDNLLKFSNRVGVSVEALSQLKFVAEIGGLTMEQFTMAMQRSTRRIAEAAQGTGEAKDALRELGLDASKLVQMSPDRQLEAIADAMLGVTNQADKVRLAMKLFDSEGVAMIQTMQGGSKEIRNLRNEADALGGTLSKSQAEDFAAYNDSIVRLKTSFSDLGKALSSVLMKPIMAVIDAFTTFFSWIAKLIRKGAELVGITDHQAEAFENLAKDAKDTSDIVVQYGAAIDEARLVSEKGAMTFRKLGEEVKFVGMTMDDVGKAGIQSLEDGLHSIMMGTSSVQDAFKSMARSIVSDMVRMAIQAQITIPLMNLLFGRSTTTISTASGYTTIGAGASTSSAGSVAHFEGGGYTGRGARAGGVDGRGGFPAILHPNETVVDHSQGQGMGGVNVTFNISTGVAQTVRAEILTLLPQITQATKNAVVDARRRGGSFSAAFGG